MLASIPPSVAEPFIFPLGFRDSDGETLSSHGTESCSSLAFAFLISTGIELETPPAADTRDC